jgi:hypothetical protein
MAQQAAVYSYYGTGGENVLDPPELPEAPEDGWEVELDTGPFGEFCSQATSKPIVRLQSE